MKKEIVEQDEKHRRELAELKTTVHGDTLAECTETMK